MGSSADLSITKHIFRIFKRKAPSLPHFFVFYHKCGTPLHKFQKLKLCGGEVYIIPEILREVIFIKLFSPAEKAIYQFIALA